MDVAYAARFPMERSCHPTLNGSESSQRSQASGGMCSHMLHCKGEERHTPRLLSRTTTVSRHGVGALVEPRHIVRVRGRSTLSTNSGKAPYARPSRLAYIISGPHPHTTQKVGRQSGLSIGCCTQSKALLQAHALQCLTQMSHLPTFLVWLACTQASHHNGIIIIIRLHVAMRAEPNVANSAVMASSHIGHQTLRWRCIENRRRVPRVRAGQQNLGTEFWACRRTGAVSFRRECRSSQAIISPMVDGVGMAWEKFEPNLLRRQLWQPFSARFMLACGAQAGWTFCRMLPSTMTLDDRVRFWTFLAA